MGEQTLKCFINGKEGEFGKAAVWSKDEIVFAITLRTISKKAYMLLRARKIYPLPGISTLQQAYADFQCNEGKGT